MECLIESILSATAWPMRPPAPYGPFHLLLTAAGTAAAVLLARRMSARERPHVLGACGLLLAAGEVYKQLFLYYVVNGRTYDWWYFPFQLCSVPMYLCLLASLPPIKGRPRLYALLCTFIQDFGLLGGVMALAAPSGLMHPYWTLTLHGFLWHFILIFLGFYCALSRKCLKGPRGFAAVLPLFAFCCLAAEFINVSAHPYGNADMFYISPYYPNRQIVFHQAALKIGIAAGNLLYLAGVALGGFLCHLACARLSRADAPGSITLREENPIHVRNTQKRPGRCGHRLP